MKPNPLPCRFALFLLAFIVGSLLWVSPLGAQNPNRPGSPDNSFVSFQMNPDGSATFRFMAPDAKKVELGGMQLLETLVYYPDQFAYVNVMSSGWFTSRPETLEKYDALLKAAAPKLKETVKYFIFTSGGEADGASRNTPPTRELFTKHGIPSEYTQMDGGHTMYVWRYDLRSFAQKIFK